MTVPGSNLLQQALGVIAAQSIVYTAWVSRTPNDIGIFVNTFADPVTVRGSFQPVPRSLLEKLGLDFNKSYVNIFISQTVIDVTRDTSSDRFQFAGINYQVLSITPWKSIDGWLQALCVEVPADV